MDEYEPINVHGILLTAVHDGGTGSVGITHTPGGARPPNRLTGPPKGVKFEHLGGPQINPEISA